jgi:mono/diheme cytochrome c family protein
MTDPRPDGGTDSVQALHKPVMDVMNDPVMLSADGKIEADEGDAAGDRVHRMHDTVMREHAEPRDGFEPVPMWVSLIFAGLLFWGGMYVGFNTADFRRDVFDRTDLRAVGPGTAGPAAPDPDPQSVDDLARIGEAKYRNICQSCHQEHGNGDPGQGVPPLRDSEWVVGTEATAARLSRILLYGMHQPVTVKGRQYNGQMPAQGGAMKNFEIAGVITFIRNNKAWGHAADKTTPAVTASAVAAARAKEGARKTNGTQSVTADELKTKFPPDYADTAAPPAKKDGDAKDGKDAKSDKDAKPTIPPAK